MSFKMYYPTLEYSGGWWKLSLYVRIFYSHLSVAIPTVICLRDVRIKTAYEADTSKLASNDV